MEGYTQKEKAKVYERAVKKWGADIQLIVIIEEMAELTKAIIKDKRKPSEQSAIKIMEEAVDVSIMLGQLFYILTNPKCGFMQSPEDIEQMVNKKLKKLECKIEGCE